MCLVAWKPQDRSSLRAGLVKKLEPEVFDNTDRISLVTSHLILDVKKNIISRKHFYQCILTLLYLLSLYKSTTDTWLKGWVCMLPWHAIPFLKGLGMLTPNPWENGWPRLWRSCNWQKNTQLNHSMAPKEPYRESEWADVSPLLKYISGAVAPRLKAPKGPYQASWVKHTKEQKSRQNYL